MTNEEFKQISEMLKKLQQQIQDIFRQQEQDIRDIYKQTQPKEDYICKMGHKNGEGYDDNCLECGVYEAKV